MSEISENKALEAYPVIPSPYYGGDEDRNLKYRFGFIKGYDQAMKDFMDKACDFLDDRIGIDQKIEVNENGEPLADSYIAYCVARKQEAERIIKLFKQYMERE